MTSCIYRAPCCSSIKDYTNMYNSSRERLMDLVM